MQACWPGSVLARTRSAWRLCQVGRAQRQGMGYAQDQAGAWQLLGGVRYSLCLTMSCPASKLACWQHDAVPNRPTYGLETLFSLAVVGRHHAADLRLNKWPHDSHTLRASVASVVCRLLDLTHPLHAALQAHFQIATVLQTQPRTAPGLWMRPCQHGPLHVQHERPQAQGVGFMVQATQPPRLEQHVAEAPLSTQSA